MKKTAVLFDLDGTLLPMDQDVFIKAYFGGLCRKIAPFGYEPEKLIQSVWAGTKAMVANTTDATNEEVFWQSFCDILGKEIMDHHEDFRDFYLNEFKAVQSSCGYPPEAAKTVALCRELGFRTILATNPIFPKEATAERMRWAGVKAEDFELITTYENSTSTKFSCDAKVMKPDPAIYLLLCEKYGLKPEECLMVGNDATEDGAALKAGLSVFLVTDDLINSKNVDISAIPQGSFTDLQAYLRTIAE